MKRICPLLLVVLAALSLCACGAQPQTPPETPSSESIPPEPESPSVPEVSIPQEEPEPEEPEIAAAQGVEVQTLLTWVPSQMSLRAAFPAKNGRLLLDTEDLTVGGRKLLGFNLENGAQEVVFPLLERDYELRPVLGAEWELKIFTPTGFQRRTWTQELDSYQLPEALREGRQKYGGAFNWDALPEKDLLTWTDAQGIWLADAGGNGARLVLSTGEIGKQPEFAKLEEYYKDFPPDGQLTFMVPRLMNGGKTLAAVFGSPQSQIGYLGHVVLDLATGEASWYDVYSVVASDLEYLDDTTILAGVTQIDVITGETRRAPRWEYTGRFSAVTGDFVHYFAGDEENGQPALLACTADRIGYPETVLTIKNVDTVFPLAVDGDRRVVCRYRKLGEEGLLLVTLPETAQ